MSKIIVRIKNNPTSLRISQRTKRMLESLAKGKETHEEIIQRLIKLASTLESSGGTSILARGNVTGTKYGLLHSSFTMQANEKEYVVVCTYNDLSSIALMRTQRLKESAGLALDWELDLEIANVKIGKEWLSPSRLGEKEKKLLYLACVKQVLEETFDINLYELTAEEDYLSTIKWTDAYDRNSLSKDSLRADILQRIK
jgi:hypothetical protein